MPLTFGVHSGNRETLPHWLADGEIDVTDCLRRPAPAGVEAVCSWPQGQGVVTEPDHPAIRANQRLRLRDCLDDPLVLLSRSDDAVAMRRLAFTRTEPGAGAPAASWISVQGQAPLPPGWLTGSIAWLRSSRHANGDGTAWSGIRRPGSSGSMTACRICP
ncbi:MAG: hypothetical protein KIT47_10530 [Rhodoferax sp.]|nr:hypothetical protein [Rhodoferax sp.]MCW5629287.1 hypothetical protein [Rhodoferax sp.]